MRNGRDQSSLNRAAAKIHFMACLSQTELFKHLPKPRKRISCAIPQHRTEMTHFRPFLFCFGCGLDPCSTVLRFVPRGAGTADRNEVLRSETWDGVVSHEIHNIVLSHLVAECWIFSIHLLFAPVGVSLSHLLHPPKYPPPSRHCPAGHSRSLTCHSSFRCLLTCHSRS
jgi:hypothetical protein